ncbi:MAG: peptide-methionine (S)-S-oxide reductase, partial [Burkholderiaceae bacterium]
TDEQFCDIGRAYNPTVFTLGEAQQRIALASKAAIEKSKPFSASIRTPVLAAPTFWPAEDAHQHFYQREPGRYAAYVHGCGRAERLERLWGPATTRPKAETESRSTQ